MYKKTYIRVGQKINFKNKNRYLFLMRIDKVNLFFKCQIILK